MSSTDNILLNPVPELTTALQTNTWGIDPSSEIIVADCFPITPEDVESVRTEVKSKGASVRVVGKARIVNLEGVTMIVVLDQRGFTVCPSLHHPEHISRFQSHPFVGEIMCDPDTCHCAFGISQYG